MAEELISTDEAILDSIGEGDDQQVTDEGTSSEDTGTTTDTGEATLQPVVNKVLRTAMEKTHQEKRLVVPKTSLTHKEILSPQEEKRGASTKQHKERKQEPIQQQRKSQPSKRK